MQHDLSIKTLVRKRSSMNVALKMTCPDIAGRVKNQLKLNL